MITVTLNSGRYRQLEILVGGTGIVAFEKYKQLVESTFPGIEYDELNGERDGWASLTGDENLVNWVLLHL